MSELKTYIASRTDGIGLTDYYLKSEADKVIARHKYKRCLAMAKLCHWKMGVFIYKEEKSNFYHRWFKRWLKIADQLKGAK